MGSKKPTPGLSRASVGSGYSIRIPGYLACEVKGQAGLGSRLKTVGDPELFIRWHFSVVFPSGPHVPGAIPGEPDRCPGAIGVGDPDGDHAFLDRKGGFDNNRRGRLDDHVPDHGGMHNPYDRRAYHHGRPYVDEPASPGALDDDVPMARRIPARGHNRSSDPRTDPEARAVARMRDDDLRVRPQTGGERQNHADCEHRQ